MKANVAKLGGVNDTVELRKGVSDATKRIQEEVRWIEECLLGLPDRNSRQTTKILYDFEVNFC